MPATRMIVERASLVADHDYAQDNDLLAPLALTTETVEGLQDRLR